MPTSRALAFMVLVASACDGGGSGAPRLPPAIGVDRNPRLTYAASCGELEEAIEDGLVLEMKAQLEQLRTGWGGRAVPVAGVPTGDAAPPAPPERFTTTNTQVEGVDEADFVQNDGTRIAALAGGRLHLVTSWPADALAEVASMAIEGWARDLFLAGGQVVVFSAVYVPRALEGDQPICVEPLAGAGVTSGAAWCGFTASNVTKITTVDVSTLSAPRVTSEIYLPGSYLAARRIDARVRLVMTDVLPYPEGVSFWPPELPYDASGAARDGAFAALAAQNEALIRGRTLDDWLRRGSVAAPDGSAHEVGYACGDFATGTAPVHLGILTLATVDLDRQALASRTSVLARADVVYASRETLYAATGHWWSWPEPGQTDATYLHAFDLRAPDRAAYLGSGVVDGSLDDSYQLDEHEGVLRVASTLTARVKGDEPWGRLELSNRITTLSLSDGALRTVGMSAPFGQEERLFGTRFLGARGFAITARQIDPLFTFDLSDPAHPRILGELTLPGFIAYLHPIDDTHLLGVGREPGPSGAMQVKVQLLDVTDLADPRPISTVLVGEGWSWSEALWDSRAFTWFPARRLLAIPFVDLAPEALVSDLRLFEVDPARGVTAAGRLSMADVYAGAAGPGWSFSWSPYVRRSVLADDYVYAISDAGIRAAKVSDLPAWLRTVAFAPP